VAAAVVILPATILLGTTFPLLTEALTHSGLAMRSSIGSLYRVNTFGAACGVVLTTFVLLPVLGVTLAFVSASITSFLVGAAALAFAVRVREGTREDQPAEIETGVSGADGNGGAAREESGSSGTPIWTFAVLAFISGLCSFGLEILWTRSMALVIGSSFYSFSAMLVAFLLGIVLGAFLHGKLWRRIASAPFLLGLLFMVLGAFSLGSFALIGLLPRLYFTLMARTALTFAGSQAIGFLLCLLPMLPVTTLFGLTFPLLSHLPQGKELSPRRVSGLLYAWDTLGSIIGAIAGGFLLVPVVGIQPSAVLVAAMLLLPGLMLLLKARGAGTGVRIGIPLSAAVVLAAAVLFFRPWNLALMTSGVYKYGLQWKAAIKDGATLTQALTRYRTLLFYKEGLECVVSVTGSGEYTFLSINGKIDAGNQADTITQKLLAHVPLILHPDPSRVFIVGWGSGGTAGSAGLYPVREIECAEIEPEVYRAAPFFKNLNRDIQADRRFRLLLSDARNLLLTRAKSFDVIISEPSNPWVSGMSSLFTSDFYSIASARLSDGGVFCQWFHYYDLTVEDVKVQIRTFCESFPHASLWLMPPRPSRTGERTVPIGDILLIGSRKPVAPDWRRIAASFSVGEIHEDLGAASIDDEMSFLCNQVADRDDLLRFSAGARLNTDDLPLIELAAPKGLFSAQGRVLEDQLSIYNALADCGRDPLPRIENSPDFADAAPQKLKSEAYEKLARACEKNLQVGRARKLREAAGALSGGR
jgi:spermidine synthase